MKMLLSQALLQAGDGSPKRGEVRIDGQTVRLFRSNRDDKIVWSENSLFAPEAFIDQEVEFDDDGTADVSDVRGRVRRVQIRVLVTLSRHLLLLDVIDPQGAAG